MLPGTYKVTANCTGFIAKDAGTIDIKKDLTGQTWSVEAGATIKGKVTLHDGTPVEGANVRFQGAGWGSTTTAADGTYRVDGLAAGSYETSIVAPHGMLTTREAFDVAERDTVVRDFVLDAGATIKASSSTRAALRSPARTSGCATTTTRARPAPTAGSCSSRSPRASTI